jgi:MFS transporter, DHA1 family, tetracycline resistance protein
MPFYKNPLYIVLFTVFVDLLGFGILIPILPVLFTSDNSNNFFGLVGMDNKISLIYYGLLLGIFPLAQFFSTPVFGQLSDKFGRKKILTFALAASTICYSLCAIGIMIRSLPLLFLARFLGGITGGNVAVAQSVIADISEPAQRSRNFGYIGAAFGLGFILGPFFGGQLAGYGLPVATSFWFTTIICAINTVIIWAFLPETKVKIDDDKSIDWARSIHEIHKAFQLKNLKLILFTSFLFQAGFSFLTTFVNPFFITRFDWHELEIGNFFGYIGIWLVISQAFLLRYFIKFGERNILKYSMFLSGFIIAFLLIPTDARFLLLVAPLFSIAVGFSQANITSLVSNTGQNEKQGEVIGIHSGIQALAQAIPPILSGFIAYSLNIAAPIVISSLVMMISGIIFVTFYKKNKVRLNYTINK